MATAWNVLEIVHSVHLKHHAYSVPLIIYFKAQIAFRIVMMAFIKI